MLNKTIINNFQITGKKTLLPKTVNAYFSDLYGNQEYNAALYLRLSVEDEINFTNKSISNPHDNVSASIENQKDILTEYARLLGWRITKIYIDDGYSGGNFERPGFQAMLKDAVAGVINLIIVKDLSRFGRSHIEVDAYIEDMFPAMGVRFIALMDGIDSEAGSEILPFRSLMNEYYLKDISRKIKSTFHAQARAGRYIGWFVAYGYKKDPAKNGRLIIDPYSSAQVRHIFELRLSKMSYAKIAGVLNTDGIITPKNYYRQNEDKTNLFLATDVWRDSTISRILKNEVYLGHSVKMKTGAVSFKHKKRVKRPSEEWIRAENTHEPIITQEIWDAVQAVNLKRCEVNINRNQEPSLLAKLLYCDNGHGLCAGASNQRYKCTTKKYRYYYCPLHKQSGYSACSWHTISELVLLRIIREDMKHQLLFAEVDDSRFVAEMQRQLTTISFTDIEKELKRMSAQLSRLHEYSVSLYEDRLNNVINIDTFISLSNKTEADQAEISAKYKRLARALEDAKLTISDTRQKISGLRPYLTLEALNGDTLRSIINKIEIGEKERNSTDKHCRQTVKINYRFTGKTN